MTDTKIKIVIKKQNMFKTITRDFYAKNLETCKNMENYKGDFKCCREVSSFKRYDKSSYSSSTCSIYFLCSNKNCEYGKNYGIEKFGDDIYIFWYNDEKFCFCYVKLPHVSVIYGKFEKDTRQEWKRIYDLYTKEKNEISKQLDELLLKTANTHIKDKKMEPSKMEEIFSLSLIKEKLNKNIQELENGKMIGIDFEIETELVNMKLCNDYTFKYVKGGFGIMSDYVIDLLYIPQQNVGYIHEYVADKNPIIEKIVLKIPFGKVNIKKDNI